MPSTLPTVSRRRVLVGAAALALLGGTVATACGASPPVKDVDALIVASNMIKLVEDELQRDELVGISRRVASAIQASESAASQA